MPRLPAPRCVADAHCSARPSPFRISASLKWIWRPGRLSAERLLGAADPNSAPYHHWQTTLRPQRDPVHRPDRVAGGHSKLEVPSEVCHPDRSLLQSKRRPDSSTRPGAKGQIVVRIDPAAASLEKAVRDEDVRPFPQWR